jgi:hypothetical protein
MNKKNRFAIDIKARCVAALNQSFQVHNGKLYKIKEQMPCIIETILMCCTKVTVVILVELIPLCV